MAAPPARRKRKKASVARPAVEEAAASESGPPAALIFGGAFVAIVLIAGLGYALTRGGSPVVTDAEPEPEPPAAPAPEVVAGQPQGKTQLSRRTREVLDLKALSGDPDWQRAAEDQTPSTNGANPLQYLSDVQGAGFSAIETLGTKISPIAQWVRQEQIVNERTPSYEDLQGYLDRNPGLWLPAMRPWQHYAYDETDGSLVVVDNLEERRLAYEAGGLDAPE